MHAILLRHALHDARAEHLLAPHLFAVALQIPLVRGGELRHVKLRCGGAVHQFAVGIELDGRRVALDRQEDLQNLAFFQVICVGQAIHLLQFFHRRAGCRSDAAERVAAPHSVGAGDHSACGDIAQ